jgi:hypothetical protein
MENFDLKKFLVENKLTINSRMLKENQEDDWRFPEPEDYLTEIIPRLLQQRAITREEAADLEEILKATNGGSGEVNDSIDIDHYQDLVDSLEEQGIMKDLERDGLTDYIQEYRDKLYGEDSQLDYLEVETDDDYEYTVLVASGDNSKTTVKLVQRQYTGEPDKVKTVQLPFVEFEKQLREKGGVTRVDSRFGDTYSDTAPDKLTTFLLSLGFKDIV